MSLSFFQTLADWPKPYISGTDLVQILGKSPDSRYGIIKRAAQKKWLHPLRRDLYLISEKAQVDTFELAPLIYGPSYISFESALSYFGWIPEGVRSTTSATSKRSREFNTHVGIFSYEHVPVKSFALGVRQVQVENKVLFIADPLKALADMIYTRKASWDSLEDLSEDLRVEQEDLEQVDPELLQALAQEYPSEKVKSALKGLWKL